MKRTEITNTEIQQVISQKNHTNACKY